MQNNAPNHDRRNKSEMKYQYKRYNCYMHNDNKILYIARSGPLLYSWKIFDRI